MKTYSSLNEHELIERYLNGDSHAFSFLVNRNKTKIFTSIYMLVKDEYLAEDIFQDVFIRIIESLKRVVTTMVMGTIGYIAIKANIIFAEMKLSENKYIVFLIIVVCGYSSTFIPNLLDSMEKVKNNIGENKVVNSEGN